MITAYAGGGYGQQFPTNLDQANCEKLFEQIVLISQKGKDDASSITTLRFIQEEIKDSKSEVGNMVFEQRLQTE